MGIPALIWNCAASSSAPVYQKDGKTYGVVKGAFRHRWWNYYERGLSYAEGQFYKEAVADFMEAMRQRDKDQRMARSYGMHFLDYFPHRELGIIFFFQEKYDEAEKELEASLAMVDTGKAKHYLNLVRKKKLELSNADKAAPVINLAKIVDQQVTNSISFEVSGEVEDDQFARDIEINDTPEFIELSAQKLSFSKTIKLKKGLNQIKIKSIDLLGKSTEKTVSVVGDFQGPALNVKNFADGDAVGENRIVLNGALADATGITSLKINENVLAYNKEKDVAFAFAVDLKQGENKIMLAATDVAGNTTTGELNLTYIPQLARSGNMPLADVRKNIFDSEPILLAFSGTVASDADRGILFAAKKSRAAFRLNFRDLTDTQTVYYETLFVDGSATGTNEIESVLINDEPLLIVPGRTVYFNQLMELNEGENKITIEVIDKKGNTASKTATIIRKVQKVHQIGSRMSIAVLPFELAGDSSMASQVVYDNLIGAFVDQDRFHIVTRGNELEAILREQKLSQTDLVDKATAVRIGKLVAAEGILMGTVRETRESIEIYARLVNTETSTVLEAKDVYGQEKVLPQIQYLTNGLALKFKHSFPLIQGMVIKVKGKQVYADFGTFSNIKKEMRFIVFKQGETIVHPVTGKVLGSDTEELGVATVVSVFEDMSIGKMIADFDTSNINVQDLIITK
jgi:TolB-like protein/tetratricopeptide (TPR) repeat protein